jgi:hypothetical protein
MGKINSRSKGQRGEHQAIEFMKEWTGMDFKRTPGSGGLRGHVTDYTEGDIVCVKKNYIFPLCVEVKFYEELNFNHLLYDVKSKIKDFWVQARESAKRAEKIPILLMRYNGLPKGFFFVMLSNKFCIDAGINPRPSLLVNGRLIITNTTELQKCKWEWVDKVAKATLKIK